MKIFFRTALIFLFSGLLLTACKKEENSNRYSDYFKISGYEFELVAGILQNSGPDIDYGPDDNWVYDGNSITLSLISSNIGFRSNPEGYLEFSGVGNRIEITLTSSIADGLDATTYQLDNMSPLALNTFSLADYSTTWDTEDTGYWYSIIEGTVTVSKIGDEYEIKISGKDEYSNSFEGYYKGTLHYFDFSPEAK